MFPLEGCFIPEASVFPCQRSFNTNNESLLLEFISVGFLFSLKTLQNNNRVVCFLSVSAAGRFVWWTAAYGLNSGVLSMSDCAVTHTPWAESTYTMCPTEEENEPEQYLLGPRWHLQVHDAKWASCRQTELSCFPLPAGCLLRCCFNKCRRRRVRTHCWEVERGNKITDAWMMQDANMFKKKIMN